MKNILTLFKHAITAVLCGVSFLPVLLWVSSISIIFVFIMLCDRWPRSCHNLVFRIKDEDELGKII
jgi:hypothetical protein